MQSEVVYLLIECDVLAIKIVLTRLLGLGWLDSSDTVAGVSRVKAECGFHDRIR